MDKESIIKYGLSSYTEIDEEASDESYDSSTNNHTIFIRLKKDNNAFCPIVVLLDITLYVVLNE